MTYVVGVFRHLLIDLRLEKRMIREAVQCRMDASVLEIYRMMAQGKIALWYLQTTSLTLTWEPPEGAVTYKSHEVPQVPSGSYVTMQIVGERCTDDWSPKDPAPQDSTARPAGDNTATPVGSRSEARRHHESFSASSQAWGDLPELEEAAWHDIDGHSLMQLSATEASMISWARVVHAFQNRRSMNDVVSFSAQNFIRKDDLRHWVMGLLQPPSDLPVQLAIWRIGPWSMIARNCDYIRMEADNWSRLFREYWRSKTECKVPDLAAPEPQPLSNSGADMRQLHVIAFEHNRMPIETYVHLFEVWTTENPAEGTGRVFLTRMAAAMPRHFKVIQIVEALGLAPLIPPDGQCFILFSLRDGIQEAVYWRHHVPEVPEFSLLQIVLVQPKKEECEAMAGDNTATPEGVFLPQQETATALLQTKLQLAETTQHQQIGQYTDGPHCFSGSFPSLHILNTFTKQVGDMLSPPGNPGKEFWNSLDFEDLDDWICIDDHVFVVDAKYTRARQTVHLADCIDGLERTWAKLQTEGSTSGGVSRKMQLPDFRPLLDTIYCKQPEHAFDVTVLFESLPDTVREAARAIKLNYTGPCHTLHIYTDGSFSSKAPDSLAAWAFVVLAFEGPLICLVDFDYGLVDTDPMGHGWTGAVRSDAKAAEAEALIRAIEWSLRRGYEMPHVMHFDAQSVGFAGSGLYGIQEADKQLRLLRALGLAFQQSLPENAVVRWHHVKGHSGVLGNELADVLAKNSFLTQTHCREMPRPDYVPYLFGARMPVEVLWIFFDQLRAKPTFPCVEDNHLVLPPMEVRSGVDGRLPGGLLTKEDNAVKAKKFRLFAVTYNVASLDQRRKPFAAQYLREQAEAHEVDLLFVQESRSRQTQMVISQSFFRIQVAADHGQGGLELWMARTDPRTKGQIFERAHINVLHAEAELLIVKARCRGQQLLIVNGHGPHSGRPHDEIVSYWSQVSDKLAQFWQPDVPVVCGFDANAHFHEPYHETVGEAGLEGTTNSGARAFLRFLQRFDLFLPSTFDEFHDGAHVTWHHSCNNSGARCDYLAIPKAWRPGSIRSYCLPSLDAGGAGIDHIPVALQVTLTLLSNRTAKKKDIFDRRALQDASTQEIEQVMEGIELPAWTSGVDEHATSLSEQIVLRLQENFPLAHSKPRKGYISDASWKIRRERLKLRHDLSSYRKQLERLSLEKAWEVWNDKAAFDQQALLVCAIRFFSRALKVRRQVAATGKALQQSLREDRTRSFEALAERSYAMREKDFLGALRALGVRNSKKPSAIQPLPILRGLDDKPLDTLETVMRRWREYFLEQEDGCETTFSQIFASADATDRTQRPCPHWDQMPTLFQLEQQFRRTAKNKAFFADNIPGELLAIAPRRMAEIFYPLICKEIVHVREPIIHKGGFLTPAFKKGDPGQPESYRSLFVSSVVGKAVHAIYRAELAAIFEKQRLPLQIGGLKGFSVGQAAHTLQSYHRTAIRRNHSVAIIFIDVANAFYRLIRQHILDVPDDQRTPAQIFDALRLPREVFEEFSQLMQQPAAMESSDAPEFLKVLFREFYATTWFRLKTDDVVVQTRRGSRPGDSFADLCFSFALQKIMEGINRQIRAEYPAIGPLWDGNRSPVRGTGPTQRLDIVTPVWADDLALAFSHPEAEVLLERTVRIASIVFDGFVAAGLKPNFKTGKTEVLIDLRGPASMQARRNLVHLDHMLRIPSRFTDYAVRVVGAYKHLGSWIQVGSGIARDLSTKFAAAHNLMTQYRNQVFANKKLALKKKLQLFQMMVVSTIVHNAALWTPRNKRQRQQLHASFVRLYKRLGVLHFGIDAQKWPITKLLNQLELPDPEITVRQARLRYLEQTCRTGQPHLWAVLQEDREWWPTVLADIQWLCGHCPELQTDERDLADWASLADFLLAHPKVWKGHIKRAVHRHVASRKLDEHWQEWHGIIMQEVVEAGFGYKAFAPIPQQPFYCLRCQRIFQRRADLAVHAFKKHDRINPARKFVQGTQCERCLKHYATYPDLVNHVKRTQSCLHFYANRGVLVPRQPGVNSRADNQQRSLLRDPFFYAEGPRCPSPAALIDDEHPEQVLLMEKWDQASVHQTAVQTWLEALRQATLQTTLFHEEIMTTFRTWCEDWCASHEDLALSGLRVFHLFECQASAEWFLTGTTRTQQIGEAAVAFFEREAWHFQDIIWTPARSVRYHPRVVAHLFSGERRQGDLQHYLEKYGFSSVSIDIIYDVTWGNLLRQDTLDTFRHALRVGALLGFMAGPPCETWSRARAVQCEGGPRMVRSCTRPQGVLHLTKRESLQVELGNRLLAVAVLLIWTALLCGATGVLEHPAQPEEDHLPSIWRLAIMHYFLRFNSCRRVRVDQGRYGGLSMKPTDLLIVHGVDDPDGLFVAGRTTPIPKTGRIGKADDGTWLTSALKQYPADFCKVLAQLFHEANTAADVQEELPSWFSKAISNLTAGFDEQAPMGPDFRPDAV